MSNQLQRSNKSKNRQPSEITGVAKCARLVCGLATVLTLMPTSSFALALGKIQTGSYMGERLTAEIPLLESTPAELASLKTAMASPDVFESLGVEFNSALLGANVSLQKRSDGQPYIRIVSSKAINDPFVNLLIVASWSSGRLVRDYTVLLDPPGLNRQPAPITTPVNMGINVQKSSTQAPAPAPAPTISANATTNTTPVVESTKQKTPAPANTQKDKQITVSRGMTAGGIAASIKPSNVSLDHMLVALLQANPNAFINGNIHLIRSGSVLTIPTSEQLAQAGKTDAGQLISVETKDFEAYKRRLAANIKTAEPSSEKLTATGKVASKVTDKKVEVATPDKLLLSTTEKNQKSKETQLATNLQAKEDAARQETLKENLADLKKIAADMGVTASAATSLQNTAVAASNTASVATSSTISAVSNASVSTVASAPLATRPKETSNTLTTPVQNSNSIISELLSNPLVLSIAGGFLALLAGFAYLRRKREKEHVTEMQDSSFNESRLHRDSFFAESGGQTIDTQLATKTTTSESFKSTQLSGPTDIDPIAEADVYLAYGRDMQAEEILKDAMVLQPTRLAIPLKLLELYAKHGESNEFEKLHDKVKSLTSPNDPEWLRVIELRKVLQSNIKMTTEASALEVNSQFGNNNQASSYTKTESIAGDNRSIWFDSELSSSLQADQADFSNSKTASTNLAEVTIQDSPKDLVSDAQEVPQNNGAHGPIEFDLSSLSLDLNTNNPSISPMEASDGQTLIDPWLTKIALAKEFQAIGDVEGARKMLQEVVVSGDDSTKAQAKALLAALH